MNFPIELDFRRRWVSHALQRLIRVVPQFIPFLALGFVLASCTGYTTPLPTDAAAPTRTRRPPNTPFPSQNRIPAETATETSLPIPQVEPVQTELDQEPVEDPLLLDEMQEVAEGGFSFQPATGYNVTLTQSQATLVSEDGGIVLSLAGGDVPGANALEGVMDRLLATISEDFEKFEAGDPYPIVVDETSGLAVDIEAELIGRPIVGKLTVVAPSDSHLFYAFAFTIQEPDDRWEMEGSKVFDAVIESIRFNELDE